MSAFTVADVTAGTGGRVVHAAAGAAGDVSVDSRTLAPGDLFFALRGPRHDGHRYLAEAVRRGAWGAVVAEDALASGEAPLPAGFALVAVPETGRALGDLAAWHRRRFTPDVVGITGSNGKTTVKEMTAAVAARRGPVLKTAGNFNNLIGLPLTLFGLDPRHRTAVLEMGMNRPGEIARLAEIADPRVGVVTNVAAAHLEHLGSLDAVAAAKGELFETMGPGSLAVINADDPASRRLEALAGGEILRFGLSREAEVRAEEVRPGSAGTAFVLITPAGRATVRLEFVGEHNVMNALAAAAAACALGVEVDETAAGLEESRPVPMRFSLTRYEPGVVIINDAYNANPASMRAALAALPMPGESRRCALVLGEMRELGEAAAAAHRELGALAAAAVPDLVIAVGEHGADLLAGAEAAGLPAGAAAQEDGWEGAARRLASWLSPGDLVLLKGSRAVGLERIVDRLAETGTIGRAVAGEEER